MLDRRQTPTVQADYNFSIVSAALQLRRADAERPGRNGLRRLLLGGLARLASGGARGVVAALAIVAGVAFVVQTAVCLPWDLQHAGPPASNGPTTGRSAHAAPDAGLSPVLVWHDQQRHHDDAQCCAARDVVSAQSAVVQAALSLAPAGVWAPLPSTRTASPGAVTLLSRSAGRPARRSLPYHARSSRRLL